MYSLAALIIALDGSRSALTKLEGVAAITMLLLYVVRYCCAFFFLYSARSLFRYVYISLSSDFLLCSVFSFHLSSFISSINYFSLSSIRSFFPLLACWGYGSPQALCLSLSLSLSDPFCLALSLPFFLAHAHPPINRPLSATPKSKQQQPRRNSGTKKVFQATAKNQGRGKGDTVSE